MEAQSQGLVVQYKVDVVFLALQLFLVARIGFRCVPSTGRTPWHQEGPMPSNRYQLGDETLSGAHPIGFHVEGVTHGACTVLQRADLDDRYEHCSGHGQDLGRPGSQCSSPSAHAGCSRFPKRALCRRFGRRFLDG